MAPGSALVTYCPFGPMFAKIHPRAVTFSAAIQLVKVSLNWQWPMENHTNMIRILRMPCIVMVNEYFVECGWGNCR